MSFFECIFTLPGIASCATADVYHKRKLFSSFASVLLLYFPPFNLRRTTQWATVSYLIRRSAFAVAPTDTGNYFGFCTNETRHHYRKS